MTQLSRLAILGLAKESTAGTYVSPTVYLPFTKADYEDKITDIKDTSFRANDTELQGIYAGVTEAEWSIDLMAYPDVVGHFLRGMIGPDTVSAGTSTTTAASSSIGATTLSSTASIAANTYISIDTTTNQEYALVTAVSGSGPYNLTVTSVAGQAVGLTKAHNSGVAIQAATTHTFAQSSLSSDKATYSLTVYDTVGTFSYSGFAFGGVDVKIDPKAAVTLSTKGSSFPGVSASAMTPTYTAFPPALGWQWTMSNAGASSTRGLSLDLKMQRKLDVIHSSDGVQIPREIFQGAFGIDGSYKAIFENQTDMNYFLNYTQGATVATLQQPVSAGGASLKFTMSKSGWIKGKRNWGEYVEADFDLSGIYNSTDGGAVKAVLSNWQTAAY